jgi:hypothetical protein
MRWSAGVGVLAGFILAVACSERTVEEEKYPDAERLCAEHCSQVFSSCYPNEPTTASEEECNENCVDAPTWTSACRWKEAELMECTTSLSCDEFWAHNAEPLTESPCHDASVEFSSCF